MGTLGGRSDDWDALIQIELYQIRLDRIAASRKGDM